MAHQRSHTDTSGPGSQTVPEPNHDKFVDLLTILVTPRRHREPQSFEKVIIKSESSYDNPTLGEMIDEVPR